MSNKEGKKTVRNTGIEILGDVPWGTHFCLFYDTKEDLNNILVPYFKAGLENNEFCVWVTSELITKEIAKKELRKAIPDFDRYLKKKQMKIVSYKDWYLQDGTFNLQRVLNPWIDLLNQALSNGFEGIRVTGNTAWLEKTNWKDFTEYEEVVNKAIGSYRMIAICSYCLDKCRASEVIDVISSHGAAIIKRKGNWELIESSELKQTKEKLFKYQKQLRSMASELLLTEERQRRHIATELHSHIGENLTLSMLKLETLRKSAPSGVFTALLDELSSLLEKVVDSTRELTFDLSSPILYRFGFERAVAEWLMQRVQGRHGIKTEFVDDGKPKPLEENVSVLLFQSVRELLVNVVKHSQAHMVKVFICRKDAQIQIIVEDDGIGMELPPNGTLPQEDGRFGLFSIWGRLNYLGGDVKIKSEPGQGTRVTLTSPLKIEKKMTEKN